MENKTTTKEAAEGIQNPASKPRRNDPTCARFAEARETQEWRRRIGQNATIEDGLHHDTDSVRTIFNEKPAHRLFADMTANGYTPSEIAKETGFSAQWVSQVLKQPFARERIVKEIKKNTQEEMKEFLEQEVLPSLRMLRNVRDGEGVRNCDRLAASNALLDRFLGKPVQPMTQNAKAPAEMSDDELREQIQRELTASQPN
jgi:hypothetical protein